MTMKMNNDIIAVALVVVFAGVSVVAGCSNSNNTDPNGTPSQGLPTKVSATDIAAVQNNPNIPADKKAGIIAAMEGSKQGPVSSIPSNVVIPKAN